MFFVDLFFREDIYRASLCKLFFVMEEANFAFCAQKPQFLVDIALCCDLFVDVTTYVIDICL